MNEAIRIRPLLKNDIDEVYCSWYKNPDGHLDYFTGSGRVFTSEVLLEDYERGRDSGSWFYYIIQTVDEIKIGNLKIGPIDTKNKTSDLVCLIGDRRFLGKGFGTVAIEQGIKVAFEDFDIRRLHSGMLKDNIPSIKAYTKAGWKIEATLKGYYWVDGKSIDRVCVSCLNPRYFDESSS